MNINALTDDELLRIVSAETELERILLDRLGDALRRADYAEQELGEQSEEWEDHVCDCSVQEDRIEYLEELLDENEIEYNK